MSWPNTAELADLAALRNQGLEWGEVAIRLNRTHRSGRTSDACSAKHRRLKLAGELEQLAVELAGTDEPRYDDLVIEWNQWLGRTVREKRTTPTTNDDNDRRKVGIICDTHCPYEARDVLAAFVAAGPYDIVIHAGDLLDYESVSSFVQERDSTMREEAQHGTWVLETLAGCGKEVIVTTDNHSRRIMKRLMGANLPPELLELLQWFSPHLDLFRLMADGLPNVNVADTAVHARDGSETTLSFLMQRGDLVVGHPDVASKIKLRSVQRFDEWLTEWKDALGLRPWRAIGMGHTHQAGVAYGRGGAKLYMELGACVTVAGMEYALSGKIGYRPPTPTYTTLEQMKKGGEWITDFNSVRQVLV